MPKRKQETPIIEGTDAYGPPTRLCIDKRFKAQPGDKVEVYGNGIPVVERDGRIVALPGEKGWEKPDMICGVMRTRGELWQVTNRNLNPRFNSIPKGTDSSTRWINFSTKQMRSPIKKTNYRMKLIG